MKLNIGSGQRRFDNAAGWINVDCISRACQRPDVICNVGKEPLPYFDDSAELVVLHHVLEHFGCGEGVAMLRECNRVLMPGGRLMVFVPDMKALARQWINGLIDDFIFFVNAYGAYQGEEGDRHRWGYTRETLKKHLSESAPWRKVMDFEWDTANGTPRVIVGADIARDWWILGVECIK